MRKVGQLRTLLRQQGFSVSRRRGSHEIWNHPSWRGRPIVLHGKDSDDACGYQRKRVHSACKVMYAEAC